MALTLSLGERTSGQKDGCLLGLMLSVEKMARPLGRVALDSWKTGTSSEIGLVIRS